MNTFLAIVWSALAGESTGFALNLARQGKNPSFEAGVAVAVVLVALGLWMRAAQEAK